MKNNNTIRISIIVPCYNHAKYLPEALKSVLEQTYKNWECIIVNDGSIDDTEEITKQWIEKDHRFRYLKIENGGLSNARNVGIEASIGEYILPLDADDLIAPRYIEKALKEFKKGKGLKIVYCEAEKFGKINGIWKLKPYSLLSIVSYNMIFCSAIFKKEDWRLVDGYDVKMVYGYEDWEFWISLLKSGGSVKKINYVGFFYRMKASSMISNMTEEHIKYSRSYIFLKHKDFFLNNYDTLLKENLELKKSFKKRLIRKIKKIASKS